MYNRYIPQSDGSFRRHSTPEPQIRSYHPSPSPPPEAPRPEPCPDPTPVCDDCPHRPQPRREPPKDRGAFTFLKNLLPPGLDSEDLLILLLLLLMGSECREDRNLPLLTLALYLFL